MFPLCIAVVKKDLSGGNELDQHCVNSVGKGLNVTDVLFICISFTMQA